MADSSYHRLLAEFRKRDNYAVVFRSALEDVAGKVDFSHVESCVAFGTASGEREIEFARRLLPNLRSFTAVEPDPESVTALRTSVLDGRLPGVETSVDEALIESWRGVDSRFDAVLLINVLGHVTANDRTALFQKLMTRYLNDAGRVVICDNITSVPSGYPQLMKQLGTPLHDYDEIEEEMLAAGFRVVFKQDLEVRRDLSDPSDDIIKFFKLLTGRVESEVRAAIDDVYSRPNMHVSMRKLAIFTKYTQLGLLTQ